MMKRILIVGDYFSPFDHPSVMELRSALNRMGYYAEIFLPSDSLKKTREKLETQVDENPFDLIVTIETGCLLAARMSNFLRIFVNPDWAAWEWMCRLLGEEECRVVHRSEDDYGPYFQYNLNPDEIEMARDMAEPDNIRLNDNMACGWFTQDLVESHLQHEHLKRFNSTTFISGMRLDTEEGISVLAQQINIFLTIIAEE